MRALLLLLLACPSEAPEEPMSPPAAPLGAAGEGVAPPPEGAAPAPVDGQPQPAGEAGPPPTGGDPAALGAPLPVLDVKAGEGVKLSGKVEYADKAGGSIRLDVLKKGDPMAELVHSTTLSAFGPFEVEIPKNYGTVQVAVFVDENSDGPSPGEPMAATSWIEVKDSPVADLSLVLRKLDASGVPGGAPPAGGAPGTGAPPAPAAGAGSATPAPG